MRSVEADSHLVAGSHLHSLEKDMADRIVAGRKVVSIAVGERRSLGVVVSRSHPVLDSRTT